VLARKRGLLKLSGEVSVSKWITSWKRWLKPSLKWAVIMPSHHLQEWNKLSYILSDVSSQDLSLSTAKTDLVFLFTP
jgi:hypothetical protein